jgi:predicted RNA-binding protein with PIN domain
MPYFLDGNNLIGIARKTGRPTEEDRAALVAEIAERLRRTRFRAVIFFDGTGQRGSSLGNLSIRAGRGESADDRIVREIEKAGTPKEITVVTADRALAGRARSLGAKAMGPEEFWNRVGAPSPVEERKPERRTNIEDWTRYFADPKNKLE